MPSRTVWHERSARDNWEVTYTPIGGRWRDADPLAEVNSKLVPRVLRFASQAFVACTPSSGTASDPTAYWAMVCTKLLQRGEAPPLSTQAQRAIGQIASPSLPEEVAPDDAIRLLVLDRRVDWDLDQSVLLHPTYERPLWTHLMRCHVDSPRWVTPQASLDALARIDGVASRWVDFLVSSPLHGFTVVEIDGTGHERQPGVDAERDSLLKKARLTVRRMTGDGALDNCDGHKLFEVAHPEVGAPPGIVDEIQRSLLGPASVHRLAFALVAAVERGFLDVGGPWKIALEDRLGVATAAAGPVLDALDAIDRLWTCGVMPEEVQINDVVWRRTEPRSTDRLLR